MKSIAFYLPQYHPIPENNEWWGKGFTEWTNVAKAHPLFKGHIQPHLPADLGFYDLRLPEMRCAQADLARQYGIHGFCYYHYWFGGRRLLERPFNEVLESGEPDFPFCLCWANENWSRAWDGGDQEILMPQAYSVEDDLQHIRWLCQAFEDPRYIRIDGKPLFLVYRASHCPEINRTVDLWRDIAVREGIGELFLCQVQSRKSEQIAPDNLGFDAAVEFAPDSRCFGKRLRRRGISNLSRLVPRKYSTCNHNIYSYKTLMQNMLDKPEPSYIRFPCVTPMWDNSARKKIAPRIFDGSTPELYEKWLSTIVQRVQKKPENRQVCFINAWNEWAEGNHLEPCQRWGHEYLEATRRALTETQIVQSGLTLSAKAGFC